jgi:hypothetical protein
MALFKRLDVLVAKKLVRPTRPFCGAIHAKIPPFIGQSVRVKKKFHPEEIFSP